MTIEIKRRRDVIKTRSLCSLFFLEHRTREIRAIYIIQHIRSARLRKVKGVSAYVCIKLEQSKKKPNQNKYPKVEK
jgi:hypothetical protein